MVNTKEEKHPLLILWEKILKHFDDFVRIKEYRAIAVKVGVFYEEFEIAIDLASDIFKREYPEIGEVVKLTPIDPSRWKNWFLDSIFQVRGINRKKDREDYTLRLKNFSTIQELFEKRNDAAHFETKWTDSMWYGTTFSSTRHALHAACAQYAQHNL